VKGSARHRAVNEKLRKRRLEVQQLVELLRHDFLILIIKSNNHRCQHRDAVPSKLGENIRDRPTLLFVRPLNRAGLRYVVSGSVAAIFLRRTGASD
jgi:hypothetical protein